MLKPLVAALRWAFGPLYLQGDQSVANQAGAAFRADMNSELQAIVTNSSGATAPSTTYAYQWWADTTAGLLKQRNAANTGWLVRSTLAETFVLARSSNTIIAAADFGRTFNCTSSFSQTLTAAATLGDGFWFQIRNAGTGVITIDPNSTETIDGSLTLALLPGQSCTVLCNGSAFTTVGLSMSVVKRKTADESVTSSTALQDDDHLTFAIGANEEWVADIYVSGTFAGSAGGIKFAVTTPAGATLEASATGGSTTTAAVSGRTTSSGTSMGDFTFSGSPTTFVGHIHVWVLNGATAGSVTLQWAQAASTGTATLLAKGSHMTAQRVA